MEENKEILKIVVVGHVDHGKSTVIGRLLFDTKSVHEGKIERVKKTCKEKGKPFEYAYLLDAFEEEQKQGITIDTTQLQFFTGKREYVIIDAPGHKEFLKNMISGAANAEAALLIIDANEGVQEQSKRHGYILSLLGIQKVYVIVNKMDIIDYSEDKFNSIKREMNEFLNTMHVYPIKYIPISAFYGENVTQKSDKMPWYEGEPVLAAIDLIEKDKGLEDKPLRFPIQDVYKFDKHKRIIAGRIESGTLRVGDEILISPSNKITRVKTIEFWQGKGKKDAVYAGMSAGITMEDEFFNKRGELITHIETPALIADVIKANLFWMGKNALVKGKKYKLKLVTQEVECEIIAVNKVIDATTLDTIENAADVKTNDVAEVTIRTKDRISFDEFRNNQSTGRFVLVEDYDVSGGGIISGAGKGIQTVCMLKKKDLQIQLGCFDEYYYVLSENTVRKIAARPKLFEVDDVLPLSGDTYAYPQDIDILDLAAGTVAIVRKSSIRDIIKFSDYSYEGHPIVDHRGFYIKVKWEEDYNQFLGEVSHKPHSYGFANRWFDFDKFREIKCRENVNVYSVEYEI